MKVYELLEKKDIADLRGEINSFVEIVLEPYINNIGKQLVNLDEKEIFDPIWGPVEFNAGEIALLDSPLIQRLRKIKQLGLASYVYCDADYSRFSHTIGVFWLAGEMANIIAKRLSQNNKEERKFVQIVRLAAIFHDSGHMYYSHVAEHYFSENENSSRFNMIKKAKEVFSNTIDDNVSLHEMISVMLVNSPSVKKLLLKIAPFLKDLDIKNEDDIIEITEYISCLILGQANDAKLLPFYQIINGPMDADKCDYLSRDSHATNVPVAVDIFRLIHKLNVDKGNLPKGFPDTKLWEDSKNEEMYYPTIKDSAVEALNQLFMARSIMYNSVYYHQKVRTAESMFRKVLEEMSLLKVPVVMDFTEVMLATDDIFGYNCYDILQRKVAAKNKKQLKIETDKLNDINSRNLLKRACSIDAENIRIFNSDEKTGYCFDRDVFMLSDSNKIKEIEQETKKQYKQICSVLGLTELFDRSFIIMDFPKVTLSDSIPNIVISYGNGNTKNYSEIFQTGTWIESKESRKREHYLVTNCEYRELAFLAMQKALFCKYGVCLESNAAICSKVDIEKINQRRRRLLTNGFYNNSLILASDIILSDYEKEIISICNRYQTFQGKKGKIITKESVESFLEQFLQIKLSEEESRCLIEGILSILLQGVYINRKSFVESIEDVFKKLGGLSHKLHICPLGRLTDSGVHLSYYLNDLNINEINVCLHSSLPEALKNSSKGDHIVFFDDGAYSGKQVGAIFEEYMNISSEKRLLKEHHVNPLNKKEKAQLKERNLSIAYVCFNAQNKKTIINAAQKAGILIDDIQYMYDMKEKIFESEKGYLTEENQRELVKKWVSKIGLQILSSVKKKGEVYKEGWSKNRVKQGALGYNDAQQFVILEASVPTYTITAFWLEDGIFQGKPWRPLFVRTDKPMTDVKRK